MKLFCILDAKYDATAFAQHAINDRFCSKFGVEKGFYGTEDRSTIQKMLYYQWKLTNMHPSDKGLLMHSVSQYTSCTDMIRNFRTAVAYSYVLGFASEGILIRNEKEFDDFVRNFYVFENCADIISYANIRSAAR